MISAPHTPCWLVGGMWLLLMGCGEVFSDYELKTVTRAEPVFQPMAVFEGSKSWIEVHVRLEGGTASVQSHALDGFDGVKLAYDDIDFFPGACPSGVITPSSVAAAASKPGEPIDDDGRWVFCSAIEVGPFSEPQSIPVAFTFWNGLESVKGTAQLTVNITDEVFE